MWIESCKPLKLLLPGQALRIKPGTPVELPDEYGRKLLSKAGDSVKEIPRVQGNATLVFGKKITWDSPLFGKCLGQVALPPIDGKVLVEHPVTEKLAWIPVSWICD